MSDTIDLKEAFEEYARKELEFYKTAKKDKLYTRVLPNLKDKERGTIDFFYNGLIVGGTIYKKSVVLNKLKITKYGSEDDVEKVVNIIIEELKKEDITCDNQLK